MSTTRIITSASSGIIKLKCAFTSSQAKNWSLRLLGFQGVQLRSYKQTKENLSAICKASNTCTNKDGPVAGSRGRQCLRDRFRMFFIGHCVFLCSWLCWTPAGGTWALMTWEAESSSPLAWGAWVELRLKLQSLPAVSVWLLRSADIFVISC